MSALLNHNQKPYFSWKGKTLNQVVSIIQKNKGEDAENIHDLFRAKPLKIYRRETLVLPNASHISNERVSAAVQHFEIPNGYTISQNEYCDRGLQTAIDIPLLQSKSDNGLCTATAVCQEQNARRRCRSAGMTVRKFDPSVPNSLVPMYSSDTRQYLQSKNKSFDRNDYHQIRQGDPSILTGTATKGNVYSNGLNDCPKMYISENQNDTFLQYTWTDPFYVTNNEQDEPQRYALTYQIVVSTGYYNIDDLNFYIHKIMENNGHYIVNKVTKVKRHFVKLVYNTYFDKIELQSYPVSPSLATDYSIPAGAGWTWPSSAICPCVIFNNNVIGNATGFGEGYYPNIRPWLDNIEADPTEAPIYRTTPYALLSTTQHHIFPLYKVVNYKPSNNRFGQDGSVNSSTRTLMNKYDAMTRNGIMFAKAYNSGLANAMSYGTPEDVQTTKSKIGYNMKCTPLFPKYGETMVSSCNRRKNLYN
jgi:hypothetical protein